MRKRDDLRASIVIPTYNRKERLIYTLLSLNKQRTKTKYEVLVCDDGSDIEVDKIIGELSLKYECRWYWQQNDGFRAAKARNTGILFGTGDIVIFLDDDMCVAEDFIDKHVEFHEAYPDTVAIGFRRRVSNYRWKSASSLGLEYLEKYSIYDHREGLFKDRYWQDVPWAYFATCNASAERIALLEAGLFDEMFKGWGLEDTELAYRLNIIGQEFLPIEEAIAYHLESERSDMTRVESPYNIPSYKLDSLERNREHFLSKYPDDRRLEMIVDWSVKLRREALEKQEKQEKLEKLDSNKILDHRIVEHHEHSDIRAYSLLVPYKTEGGGEVDHSLLTPYVEEVGSEPRKSKPRFIKKIVVGAMYPIGSCMGGLLGGVKYVFMTPIVLLIGTTYFILFVVTGRYRKIFRGPL